MCGIPVLKKDEIIPLKGMQRRNRKLERTFMAHLLQAQSEAVEPRSGLGLCQGVFYVYKA